MGSDFDNEESGVPGIKRYWAVLYVFKFYNSNDIFFSCTVTVCPSGSSSCDIVSLKINQTLWSVTLFTILICCSRKKGFRHLFTFTIKALTYTCSSQTGSFCSLCINRLKYTDPKWKLYIAFKSIYFDDKLSFGVNFFGHRIFNILSMSWKNNWIKIKKMHDFYE